jgi:hypothetical protein
LVSRLNKSFRNQLIENLPFVCIQIAAPIRAPSVRLIAEDRKFMVIDGGDIWSFYAPQGTRNIARASP